MFLWSKIYKFIKITHYEVGTLECQLLIKKIKNKTKTKFIQNLEVLYGTEKRNPTSRIIKKNKKQKKIPKKKPEKNKKKIFQWPETIVIILNFHWKYYKKWLNLL